MTTWGRRLLDPFGTLLVLLLAGLALRVVIAAVILPQGGFHTDVNAFSAWAGRLADVGPGEFYAPGYFADYPPGYLYVLWLVGEVSRFVEPMLGGLSPIRGLIKVPGIAADLGVAVLIYLIATRFFGDRPPVRWLGSGARIGLIGAAVYLFNPGVVFNSAVWGQMDSVGALVILIGLYSLGRGWTEAAGLAAVVAVLIKFQFGWLIPIVAVVGLKRHLFGRSSDPALAARPDPVRILTSLAVGFGTAVAMLLPFGMTILPTGDPTTSLIDKFRAAADQYQGLSINAFNIWRNPWSGLGDTQFWGNDQGIALTLGALNVTWAMVGIGLFALVAVIALVAVARRDDMQGLLMASLTMAVAFFGLPTRVHERYLFPALALAAPLVGVAARWAAAYLALATMFFLNIYWAYSADWSYASPPVINPGIGGEPFTRDPLLAATLLSDWGIYLVSLSVIVVLGWIVWQALRPTETEAVATREVDVEAAATAAAAADAVRAARGRPGWRWLRQDPVSEPEREPPRRLDRWDLALVVGLVALALVLRLWRLDQPRSMIFDEVYHGRTAMEFLANWKWGWDRDPYEWTHPMLAKYLIAAGIEVANPNQVTGSTDLPSPATSLAVAPQKTASGWPASIVFTSDGSRTIEARDASTGALVDDWEAPGPVASLAWDQDAGRLLAGLENSGTIAAWDLNAFLSGEADRAPPVAAPGIETGMRAVLEIVVPFGDVVIVVRGPDEVAVLERTTGAELGRRDITVGAITYTTAVSGDNEASARVVALDLEAGTILSLDATTLRTQATQTPESAPLGTILTSGRGNNQLIWVPIGPLPATAEHPATTGGMMILRGGAIVPDDTIPLPGPARTLGWDPVANLVHVAGPQQVWTIEPHGDNRSGYAVFDETLLDGEPLALAFDVSDTSQTDDHGRLIVSTQHADGGALVNLDVGDDAYAWRLAAAIFGALLAGLVYLFAAMLFRRRAIAVLAGLFVATDLMGFAMSRIAMNDIFVATFIVAAYALFWPIWGGRWQRSAWWVLPLVGVMIGLAAASKWVGWYALIGLWFLVLLRSQLGRFILVAATGFAVMAVGMGAPWPGSPWPPWPFTVIALGVLALALALAWIRPVRLSGGELLAVPALALVVGVIGLSFALAFPTVAGREPGSLVELGFGILFRGLEAQWPAFVALGIGALLLLARAVRSLRRPRSDARWFSPAEMGGFAWPWILACLLIVPLAVYVATFTPWLDVGHSFAIPNSGPGYAWSMDELHAQMFGYHYGLQAGHAASSPWWSWPLDLKPVWFYSHSFDLLRVATTYNGGNPVLFWASVPAIGAALLLAWRRRSWALLLLVVAFGFQFVPWARIERATFQYHYLTAVLFAFVAIAYVLDEVLRDRWLRDYGIAFLVAVAVTGLLIYPLNSALAMPDWYINAARALPPWNYAFQFPGPPQGDRPPLISADAFVLALATVVSLAAAAFASFGRDLLGGRLPARFAVPEVASVAEGASGRATKSGSQDQDADDDQADGPHEVPAQPG
jgi:Gpi18-like mannosyltransferase